MALIEGVKRCRVELLRFRKKGVNFQGFRV